MKNDNYFLLMLTLCCAGAFSCFAMLFFLGALSPFFKAVIFILNILYIFGALHYKRRYADYNRRKREYTSLKRKKHNYPENSYYPGIRRSV